MMRMEIGPHATAGDGSAGRARITRTRQWSISRTNGARGPEGRGCLAEDTGGAVGPKRCQLKELERENNRLCKAVTAQTPLA